MRATIEKDQTSSVEEGLIEVYRKLRPSEPPTVDSSQQPVSYTHLFAFTRKDFGYLRQTYVLP